MTIRRGIRDPVRLEAWTRRVYATTQLHELVVEDDDAAEPMVLMADVPADGERVAPSPRVDRRRARRMICRSAAAPRGGKRPPRQFFLPDAATAGASRATPPPERGSRGRTVHQRMRMALDDSFSGGAACAS
jgi:hypothetical protein